MPERVGFVVLCEDKQQQVFARQFLKDSFGKALGRVRYCKLPAGKGCGEQYVRDTYVREVRTLRSKGSYQPSLRLIVGIDADTESVGYRIRQLDEALKEAGMPVREAHECIGVFVPKRNIETWIHSLHGEAVDEEIAYPKFSRNESDCKPYVTQLVEQCRSGGLADDAPASLAAACQELERLKA